MCYFYIETPKLIFRWLEEEDSNSIFEYASNLEVSRYTSWKPHDSIKDTITFIKEAHAGYERGEFGPFAICLKIRPDHVIGTIRIKPGRHIYEGELSYSLSQKYWQQGIMFEAVDTILKLCFERWGFKRIFARCSLENEASQALVSKVGLTYEGCLRWSAFSKNRFWDVKYYSILLQEWEEQQKNKA